MKTDSVHCPTMPATVQYNVRSDGTAEVWMRKNIQQTTTADEDGENLEYTYEEVYFRTTATKEEIEGNFESYWESGQGWEPDVPMTQDQKIEALQTKLDQANAELAQTKTDNDMAIAELTMVMAAMMGGTSGGGEDDV